MVSRRARGRAGPDAEGRGHPRRAGAGGARGVACVASGDGLKLEADQVRVALGFVVLFTLPRMLHAQAPVSVRGIVTRAAGVGVADADVTVRDTLGAAIVRSRTDTAGRFELLLNQR